ncbi:EamA family transporter [Hydrogenophaga taeniospiralis]|jgi:drug/metabolite transporter (DMT)-like permease|uniref:EamA family transporter n=1 Tax=Hydrogenophaga taeniospiralis TaxID=65656 RepID=UPI001CFA0DF5|nr:EamA family transporter [Hydrogenophaga taeniospiralis]MCB4364625.1 EamA family transporter [Hydrogenophaga taeniospiralis]
MARIIDHLYIIGTILFTVYSQLVMRWQVAAAGPLPIDAPGKASYVINLLLNPWVLSGMVATFLAGISWMLAMTKFEISYAYPFVSLNYILVLAAAFFLLNETLSATKLMGSALVIIGIIVISKG